MHPDYDDYTLANDVALLFIDEDLSSDSRLSTVLVPDLSVDEPCCSVGDDLQVLGYGARFEGGPPTDTLEFSNQKFIDNDACNDLFADFNSTFVDWVEDSMVCSVGDNTDACQGDSGGPLIKTDTRVQVGVTSWGIGCNRFTSPQNDSRLPAVAANLGLFKSWIEQEISAVANADVTLPPLTTTTTTDAPTTSSSSTMSADSDSSEDSDSESGSESDESERSLRFLRSRTGRVSRASSPGIISVVDGGAFESTTKAMGGEVNSDGTNGDGDDASYHLEVDLSRNVLVSLWVTVLLITVCISGWCVWWNTSKGAVVDRFS
jgi:hypothetical protein